jgi:hypothetical protein
MKRTHHPTLKLQTLTLQVEHEIHHGQRWVGA